MSAQYQENHDQDNHDDDDNDDDDKDNDDDDENTDATTRAAQSPAIDIMSAQYQEAQRGSPSYWNIIVASDSLSGLTSTVLQ